MWSPLSRILEAIGSVRLPPWRKRNTLRVGDPQLPDFLGTSRWKAHLNPRVLSETWAPRSAGPWRPFHVLTLFVALDYLKKEDIGPAASDPLPVRDIRAPDWLDTRTLLFVDLSGPQSVALGAALATQGCDLVCTFNNWPHPDALLPSHHVLATLLRYASWLHDERRYGTTPAPVAWLCDADRLGRHPGKPGQFDNRYYLEDTLMPGPAYLRQRGITRLVHLGAEGASIRDDLAEHLLQYAQQGFEVLATSLKGGTGWAPPAPLALTPGRFLAAGYLLAAGGGFGATVPHPASGG